QRMHVTGAVDAGQNKTLAWVERQSLPVEVGGGHEKGSEQRLAPITHAACSLGWLFTTAISASSPWSSAPKGMLNGGAKRNTLSADTVTRTFCWRSASRIGRAGALSSMPMRQ